MTEKTIKPGDEGYFEPANTMKVLADITRPIVKECPVITKRFACTRVAGHDGPHAAHGPRDYQYATWEDEETQ